MGRLFFAARHESIRLSNHSEGFVALAATFLAYGVSANAGGLRVRRRLCLRGDHPGR